MAEDLQKHFNQIQYFRSQLIPSIPPKEVPQRAFHLVPPPSLVGGSKDMSGNWAIGRLVWYTPQGMCYSMLFGTNIQTNFNMLSVRSHSEWV